MSRSPKPLREPRVLVAKPAFRGDAADGLREGPVFFEVSPVEPRCVLLQDGKVFYYLSPDGARLLGSALAVIAEEIDPLDGS